MARSLGIGPILAPERLRAPEALAAVLELDPALAVLADYGQIVPAAILDLPHAALNPPPFAPAAVPWRDAHPGRDPRRRRGDGRHDDPHGCGHRHRPIVGQERLPLDGTGNDTRAGGSALGPRGELIALTLGPWLAGELASAPGRGPAPRSRVHSGARTAVFVPRFRRAVERQVRAYKPVARIVVETPAGRLIVHAASVDDGTAGPAGTIDRVGLNTVEGRLAFERVQPAGGREMPWDDYLRGGAKVVGSSIVE
jgi:hypothetical protein